MTDVQESGARFIKAFNAHNEDGMRALTHPNATFSAPGDVQLRGVEATGYATKWLRACPDGRLTVRNELVSDQWLVEEMISEGTHQGPMETQAGTLSATGKKLAIKAVMITRYESDLALETRLYFDQVDVLNQLGAMPALATAAV
jgi:SnoaL-like polyketide cyclase